MKLDIPLTPIEEARLLEFAKLKDQPPERVLIQALRVYDMIEWHWAKGQRMAWLDKEGKLIPEEAHGCGGE